MQYVQREEVYKKYLNFKQWHTTLRAKVENLCNKEEPLMEEKRKSERRKLVAFAPVYTSPQHLLLGYLGNLSADGVMVVGEKALELGTQITLEIEFPAKPEFPARRVIIPCRVIWCKPEAKTEYCNTGFEFQEISEQNKSILGVILERYQFRLPTRA